MVDKPISEIDVAYYSKEISISWTHFDLPTRWQIPQRTTFASVWSNLNELQKYVLLVRDLSQGFDVLNNRIVVMMPTNSW